MACVVPRRVSDGTLSAASLDTLAGFGGLLEVSTPNEDLTSSPDGLGAATGTTSLEAEEERGPSPSRFRTAISRMVETWGFIIRAAGAKVIVMGVSAVFGLVTTRLIIQHFGTAAYAQYGLLASVPNLLPFADLGIGAAILNVVGASKDVRSDEQVQRTITTAIRVLIASAIAIAAGGIVLEAIHAWPALLGKGLLPNAGMTATICLIVYVSVLPLAVGQRVIVGMRRSATQVLSQGVVSPAFCLAVIVCVVLNIPAGSQLSILSYVANTLTTLICLFVAWRATSPMLRRAFHDVPRLKAVPGVKVLNVAWPQLIQNMVIPLGFEFDRILISHFSVQATLARYNLASQLFGMVTQVILVAGVALWPFYARQRAMNSVSSPAGPAVVYGAMALVLGVALAAIAPWLMGALSKGAIAPDPWTLIGFLGFAVMTAIKQPLGMYMTDPRGMRAQIPWILVMVPVNIALAIVLIKHLGAGGPMVSATLTSFVFQIIPYSLWVRRDVKRRRKEISASSETSA